MLRPKMSNIGIGAYRITKDIIEPAFINRRLSSLFAMTKEEFLETVSPDNALGGIFTSTMPLSSLLDDDGTLYIHQNTIERNAITKNNAVKPLKIIYSVKHIVDFTYYIIFIMFEPILEHNHFLFNDAEFDIDDFIYQETNEIGMEYRRQSHMLFLMTTQSSLQSCWDVTDDEFMSLFSNFIHNDDQDRVEQSLHMAFEKPEHGCLSMRFQLLHKTFKWIRFWYCTTSDQSGEVDTLFAVFTRTPNASDTAAENTDHPQSAAEMNPSLFLRMRFNAATGKRFYAKNDVDLNYFQLSDYETTLHTLRDFFLHPDDRDNIKHMLARYQSSQNSLKESSYFSFDARFFMHSVNHHKASDAYRWYRIVEELSATNQENKSIIYLSIFDIHDIKTAEQETEQQQDLDSVTGLQQFSSFVQNADKLYENISRRDQMDWSASLILIQFDLFFHSKELNTESVTRKIYAQIGETAKAFMHSHEICCRYSDDTIALLLFSGNNTAKTADRLDILQLSLQTANSIDYSIEPRIGYCTITKDQPLSLAQTFANATIALYFTSQSGYSDIVNYADIEPQAACSLKPAPQNTVLETNPASSDKVLYIRTFGCFDLFIDGVAIPFVNKKAKELLALLVDRRGSYISPDQVISYLWEDEPSDSRMLARLRKTAFLLKQHLDKYGIGDIVTSVQGNRRLVVSDAIKCDYYDYLAGKEKNIYYIGAYMPEYSWAESTNALLETRMNNHQSG